MILQQQRSNLKNASVLATVDGKVPILSTDFLTFVEELRQNTSIPGISLGVVRLAGESEEPITQFAAFGRKLEDGDGHDLTSDVGFPFIIQIIDIPRPNPPLLLRHSSAWHPVLRRSYQRPWGC